MDPIYQRLVSERLFEPDPPRGVEDPHRLPAVHPRSVEHGGTVAYAGHQDHQLPAPQPRGFTDPDGSVYTQVPPDAFAWFDDVDSRTIVDPGAPR